MVNFSDRDPTPEPLYREYKSRRTALMEPRKDAKVPTHGTPRNVGEWQNLAIAMWDESSGDVLCVRYLVNAFNRCYGLEAYNVKRNPLEPVYIYSYDDWVAYKALCNIGGGAR